MRNGGAGGMNGGWPYWFERAGHTANAALMDWPPLSVESLRAYVDYIDRLLSRADDYVFRCYGLNHIQLPPLTIIKI